MTVSEHPYRVPEGRACAPSRGTKGSLKLEILTARLILIAWSASRLAIGVFRGFDIDCVLALLVLASALLWTVSAWRADQIAARDAASRRR